jgi:hypothetical protein
MWIWSSLAAARRLDARLAALEARVAAAEALAARAARRGGK